MYSITRHKDPATASKAKVLADQIDSVKATGPNEVTLVLTSPNADLPVILGTFHFHIVKEGTTDFTTGIGTGPYKLKEFKPGVRSVVVRNDNYWKPGKPYLDEIEFVGIGDESARVNALLSGGMDLVGLGQSALGRAHHRHAGLSRSSRPSRASTPTSSCARTSAPAPTRISCSAMKYLFDREQMKKTIALDQAVVAQRPADRPDQPLLLRRPAAAAVRPGQGEVPPAEVRHHRRGAGRRVAGGAVLGRNGAGDAADGASASAWTSTSSACRPTATGPTTG